MGSSSLEESDVLIVGAGPAGCTAGILLARQGVRVSILEQRHRMHQKVCGDLIGPRVLWLLEALRIGWKKEEPLGKGIRSISIYDEGKLRSWARFSGDRDGESPPALTMRRDVFDGLLQERALEAGCAIHYGTGFRSLVRRSVGTVQCSAVEEGRERCFRARMLIGADGVNSKVARITGLADRRPEKTILAVRGYFSNVKGLRDSIELYFLRRILPGYAWVIPLGEKIANIGLGMRADVCIRKQVRLQAELKRWIRDHPVLASRMRTAEPKGKIQGWPVGSYGGRRKRSDSHVLLLGDAGSFSDPLTGEGIFGAMQSAFLSVPVILEAFGTGDFSRARLSRFDEEARTCFDASCGATTWLSSLPSHHRLLQPLVVWGLNRVETACLLDTGYANAVGSFFTGMQARKRIWNAKWFRRTFLG